MEEILSDYRRSSPEIFYWIAFSQNSLGNTLMEIFKIKLQVFYCKFTKNTLSRVFFWELLRICIRTPFFGVFFFFCSKESSSIFRKSCVPTKWITLITTLSIPHQRCNHESNVIEHILIRSTKRWQPNAQLRYRLQNSFPVFSESERINQLLFPYKNRGKTVGFWWFQGDSC